METIVIPNLKHVLTQTKYLELILSCGGSLGQLFSRERPAGINTTAVKVMKEMVQLNRQKVHPDILRFCEVLMDAACSMENQYLSYEDKNVDIDFLNRQRKLTMRTHKIYEQALLNELTKDLSKLGSLVEKHKKIRAELQTQTMVYQEMQNKLSVTKLSFYKNNNSTARALTAQEKKIKMENIRCLVAWYRFQGESAQYVFNRAQRLCHKENEIVMKMKEVENDVLNKMKSCLSEELSDGLAEMQAIGLDPCVSAKSAERILAKVTELDEDFSDIIYNIVTAKCHRYTCTSLSQRDPDRRTGDKISSAYDNRSNVEFNSHTALCNEQTSSNNNDDTAEDNSKAEDGKEINSDIGTCNIRNDTTDDNSKVVDTEINKIKRPLNLDDIPFIDASETADDNVKVVDDMEIKINKRPLNLDDIPYIDASDTSINLKEVDADNVNLQIDPSFTDLQESDSQPSGAEQAIFCTNHYVKAIDGTENAEKSFLLKSRGKKIKQKVYHLDNISFGWVRSKPWSLKKRWGFFCPDDVISIN